MKVAFFSETGSNQYYPRSFENARTEVAWAIALNAPMCSLSVLPEDHFDLGIVLVPKLNPEVVHLEFIRGCCDKVAVMQEGPHWYFQDYSIDKQFNYYNTLMEADWVYCHNESDVNYYKGLGCKDVRVMQSLMIVDGVESNKESRDGVMLGGNFVSWYGGFDSYMVARQLDMKIYCVSMGRKQELEDKIDDILYIPYLNWKDWIKHLDTYKVGIHMMRTHAAGTFAMNCAFHGIPCIGYKGLDTQETCHPLTTVDIGDLERATWNAEKLKDDNFYELCSVTAKRRFKQHYTETAWKRRWKIENNR